MHRVFSGSTLSSPPQSKLLVGCNAHQTALTCTMRDDDTQSRQLDHSSSIGSLGSDITMPAAVQIEPAAQSGAVLVRRVSSGLPFPRGPSMSSSSWNGDPASPSSAEVSPTRQRSPSNLRNLSRQSISRRISRRMMDEQEEVVEDPASRHEENCLVSGHAIHSFRPASLPTGPTVSRQPTPVRMGDRLTSFSAPLPPPPRSLASSEQPTPERRSPSLARSLGHSHGEAMDQAAHLADPADPTDHVAVQLTAGGAAPPLPGSHRQSRDEIEDEIEVEIEDQIEQEIMGIQEGRLRSPGSPPAAPRLSAARGGAMSGAVGGAVGGAMGGAVGGAVDRQAVDAHTLRRPSAQLDAQLCASQLCPPSAFPPGASASAASAPSAAPAASPPTREDLESGVQSGVQSVSMPRDVTREATREGTRERRPSLADICHGEFQTYQAEQSAVAARKIHDLAHGQVTLLRP